MSRATTATFRVQVGAFSDNNNNNNNNTTLTAIESTPCEGIHFALKVCLDVCKLEAATVHHRE
ncbi:hypothetical protein ACE6H2_021239 [Prunus campanulata]